MQIHELPSQSATYDTDQYALDTGSTTRKISFANLKDTLLGTGDISGIGDGTVKGAIRVLNTALFSSANAVPIMSLGAGLHYLSNPTDAPAGTLGVAIVKASPNAQYEADYKAVIWIPLTTTTGAVYVRVRGGESVDSGWIRMPGRDEITAITTNITQLTGRLAAERFTASNSESPFTAAEVIGYHDKAINTVRMTFFFRASSAITTSTPIATIPEAYRPSANIGGHGAFYASAGFVPGMWRVTTSGEIYQMVGNTITSGHGYIEYSL